MSVTQNASRIWNHSGVELGLRQIGRKTTVRGCEQR